MAAGPAHAAPTITEPVALDRPATALAAGPDGALWAVVDGHLVRITPDGVPEVVDGLAADRDAVAVTSGADDTVWFASDTGHLGRITSGGVVSDFGPLRGVPTSMVLGPDGNVWVGEQHTNIGEADDTGAAARHMTGALARVTPAGEITEFPIGDVHPTDVAAGTDGAIWFLEEDTVGRVTTAGEATTFDAGLKATALAAGLGRMWLTSAEDLATIAGDGVVTPTGKATGAEAIAVGPDGAMWLTMDDGIGRVTPDGKVDKHKGLTTGAGPAIVPGPDGAMWFAHSKPVLGRITVPPAVDAATADPTSVRAVVRANSQPATATLTLRKAKGGLVTKQDVGVAPGAAPVEVAFALSGLEPATEYVASVSAASDAGDAITAAEASFTTPPAPVEGSGPEATPIPTLKKTIVVRPNRGAVRYKTPGGTFTELVGSDAVPIGALVDTRRGEVRLVTELADGSTQAGFFYGGLFRVRQARGGMTRIVLAGRLGCASRRSVATISRKRKKRRVWGRDSGGKFRTQGRDSVATVRGTRWLTQDSCRGTLTRVLDGAVSVRPIGKGRAVLVKAGERHFVKHR